MTNELERQAEQQVEPPAKKKRSVRKVSENNTDQPVRWVQLRLIPIWLRVIIVVLLFFAAVGLGLLVGYSIIGDGNAGDVLKWDTWQHLLDIINGQE